MRPLAMLATTASTGWLFLVWAVVAFGSLWLLDLKLYRDDVPANTVTAWIRAACPSRLSRVLLAVLVVLLAVVLIGHLCLGWWVGPTVS